MNKLDYIFAGKATFTVVSHKTGVSFTFHVSECDKDKIRGDSEFIHFVSVLSGPNNNTDYRSVAVVFNKRWVRPTRFCSYQTPSVKAIAWLMKKIYDDSWRNRAGEQIPGCDFLPSTKCCRCGRTLTTPESIALGIGPECATKAMGF